MLPELLAMAATAAPNLRKLSVFALEYCTGTVLASCACLTQINKLSLRGLELLNRRDGPGTLVSQIRCQADTFKITMCEILEMTNTKKRMFPLDALQKS